MNIYFVSNNKDKIEEMKSLFSSTIYKIIPFSDPSLFEIQTANSDQLVKDKTLKAFEIVQRPLIVEHTHLNIESINGFPGGLTASFWESFQADLTCKHFGNSKATAETTIAYCDMRHIHLFNGKIAGSISPTPRGDSTFQWDTVFVPDGFTQTFAEMGREKKSEISMRTIAVQKLLAHLGQPWIK